ncbi:MAG: carboxymuconolactone decarboxylase family protein, partial [Cyanobacteria bacterium]|nr:carboxymuconolactone decarboxylase family protein [Cyanobacteriota bacterium]
MTPLFQSTPSIQLVEDAEGGPQVAALYQAITEQLGKVPNVMKVLANAPHVLQGGLALDGAIAGGTLSAALKNKIALAVSQKNECDYCLSAFTAIGNSLNTPTEALSTCRIAQSEDPKEVIALKFAQSIVLNRGQVGAAALAEIREA